MNTFDLDKQYIASTYKRFPVEIVSGKGSLVKDVNGKEYIDMGSGIAVTSFGVADDAWIAAVEKQIHCVQHMSNLYYTAPCAKLAQALCEKTGMAKVFFSNSGAEANECAIKVARKWAAEHKGPACSMIVTLENSFHGRTLTTLAATGQDHYHELYQPLTPGFASFPAGDLDALCAREESLSRDELADALARALSNRPMMLKLLSMNLYDMEANSRMERLVEFKTAYGASVAALDRCLRKFVPSLDETDRQTFLYTLLPFIYGLYPYTVVTEKQRSAMEEAGIRYVYMSTYDMAYTFLRTILGGLT